MVSWCCLLLQHVQQQLTPLFVPRTGVCHIQDDKAVDRAWKKESAEAGDGLGQVLYQLFKKRRSGVLSGPLLSQIWTTR